MAEPVTVTVERHIAAPPERVFDAWLDPESVRHWLFATPGGVMERVEVDPRVGGGFTIVERREGENGAAQSPGLRDGGPILAEHFGEYVEIERPRRLAFDFWTSFSEERTRVSVAIAPDGEGALLTLTHDGVWADWEEKTRQGWTTILDGLVHALAE
jgi:uncharacterized protein YndB with AHSA1/START domain